MSKEFWPGTTVEKSSGNGFDLGLRTSDACWADIYTSSKLSQASTQGNEKRRMEGTDNSTFHGMSRKADEAIKRHGGAYTRAKPQGESNAARLRGFLKDGPKDSRELGQLMGLTARHVRGLLQWDVDHGKVKKLHGEGLVRYALAGTQ